MFPVLRIENLDKGKSKWIEHPDWQEYRQAMVQEQRLLIRIRIEHAGPDKSG